MSLSALIPPDDPAAQHAARRPALHPWRELAAVGLLTALAALLSAHFEFSERLVLWLRRRESMQMDELPGVLLVLTCGLLWFAWRRYQDLALALQAHQRAEQRLADQLERNRALHRELLEVQERERRSIARELHDELGQYLGALRFDLHAMVHLERVHQQREVPVLEREALFSRATQTLGHVQATLRDLIRRLRPVALDELGLTAALDQLVAGWRLRLPETRFELVCRDLDELPDEGAAIATFRIVQEALTNVARHSRAGRVEIRVGQRSADAGQEIAIDVADDGIGLDPRRMCSGLGLVSMAERATALGGRLDWQSAPGDGFVLTAILPLTPLPAPVQPGEQAA